LKCFSKGIVQGSGKTEGRILMQIMGQAHAELSTNCMGVLVQESLDKKRRKPDERNTKRI
jgi:hypothetical protein